MLITYYLLMITASFFSINLFIKIAKIKQIVDIGSKKKMHEGVVPRGAGIAFGLVYLFSISIVFIQNHISLDVFLPIFFGSFSCLLLGLLDDMYDLEILVKFSFQFIIIFLLIVYFFNHQLFEHDITLDILLIIIMTFLSTWILNAYNFIDGADGHLSSVACMQGVLIITSLCMSENFNLIIPIFLLCSVLLVFLKFNWPPAKVFMGDAGSLFVGINFIIFISLIIKSSLISFFSILIIFSYFLVDTFGTFVIRLYLKKSWKVRHRSHPYQNFSRIYSHSMMSKVTIIYHLIWLLPLLILSSIFKSYEAFISFISIIPALVFLIKFGPARSPE